MSNAQRDNSGSGSGDGNGNRDQNPNPVNANVLSSEKLNKILYGLLQQKELVKYILMSVQNGAAEQALTAQECQKYEEVGKRLIDTIKKQ